MEQHNTQVPESVTSGMGEDSHSVHLEVPTVTAESLAAAADDQWVAQVVSSGEFDFPLLQWRNAEVSLCQPIGTKLYTSAPAINAELLGALKKARDFADSVHDGEYGWSECTRDELVEQIDAALKKATA